ncbi:MAG: hypothetical protein GX130_12765 [Candidatus Hydrogenedens sp.]|nr:hypothetical protein [Candidatus Hydrogenedens sp.]
MSFSEELKEDLSPLSFESLQAEMGELPVAAPEGEEEIPLAPEESAAPLKSEVDREPIPLKEISMEALTGSSPQRRPLWVDALFCILFAGTLLALVFFKSGFASYQPWISHVAILLALGGAGWAFLGLRSAKSLAGKRFTWGIVAVGLIVALLAFAVRMP